ncbi:MAG: SurA N-terminal domain-containing protein [Candidatus Pacebacteria bacterium]|nr:SurA N-terminal domain-containing protein [Candidatus Paceibacterota bacterium]
MAKLKKRQRFWLLTTLLSFLIVILIVLNSKFQGLIMVATVNDRPIYSWQFFPWFWKKYGPQALEEMIITNLLTEEASKQQVAVTQNDLTLKISQIQKDYGGHARLLDYLSQEGISYQEFEDHLRRQLLIEKLISKKITVSPEETEIFIGRYRQQMQASDEAGLFKEAQEIIWEQKLDENFSNYLLELKDKAKINQFLDFKEKPDFFGA